MKKEIILSTEHETFSFGRKLAAYMPRGGFIALYGDLGSGKSVLARGIGDYLGLSNITSPTFTIMQRYDTIPVLYHIDAYRLSSEEELYDIGYEECFSETSLIVLEWADIVPNALPSCRIDILLHGNGMEPRTAEINCMDELFSEEQFLAL